MAMNTRVYNLAQDWIRWIDTRRFFGPAPQQNILGRLIEKSRPSKGAPDAKLNAELSAFNRAVIALEPGLFIPFVVVYCGLREKPIKEIAEELGIGKNQLYERAHTAAARVAKMARKIGEAEQRGC
jgi:hypothetical protein